MKEEREMWDLIRKGAPLPEPPTWFAVRTMARLRSECPQQSPWKLVQRWIWAAACAIILISGVATWQVRAIHRQNEQVTFAALDALANDDKSHDQDGAWLISY